MSVFHWDASKFIDLAVIFSKCFFLPLLEFTVLPQTTCISAESNIYAVATFHKFRLHCSVCSAQLHSTRRYFFSSLFLLPFVLQSSGAESFACYFYFVISTNPTMELFMVAAVALPLPTRSGLGVWCWNTIKKRFYLIS